jgi:hypothetical protein
VGRVKEFILLIGEIFFIVLLQRVIDEFMTEFKLETQKRFVNIACVLGSLYLLLNFVYDNILSEIATFVKFPF